MPTPVSSEALARWRGAQKRYSQASSKLARIRMGLGPKLSRTSEEHALWEIARIEYTEESKTYEKERLAYQSALYKSVATSGVDDLEQKIRNILQNISLDMFARSKAEEQHEAMMLEQRLRAEASPEIAGQMAEIKKAAMARLHSSEQIMETTDALDSDLFDDQENTPEPIESPAPIGLGPQASKPQG